MTKIIVDAFGGDNSPSAQVEGAVLAVRQNPLIEVVLTGDKNILQEELKKISPEALDRISIVHAPGVITNDDVPTQAVKQKKDSSMVAALELLANDVTAHAVVSSGSTGALLTGAFTIVRRIKSISRPSLASVIPTLSDGFVVFMDCGANSDCKPEQLKDFAVMGDAYAKTALGVKNPRVGILSNGTEDKKGNELSKAAFGLIKESGLNFVGNVEGRDVLGGGCDVVVTDGFTGNVALKSYEGMANAIFSLLKKEIKSNGFKAKLGYLLLKKSLKKVKGTLDYNEIGGAVFLGVQKPVIKAHGSSGAKAVGAAVLQAARVAESGFTDKLKEMI